MFSTVIRITVILVGAFKAISIVDPKSSDAILGLLAGAVVGLAFASQDTIKNVFGAVMLIVDQPFTLGDLINIGSHEGKVESLGLRSTTIVMLDGQKPRHPERRPRHARDRQHHAPRLHPLRRTSSTSRPTRRPKRSARPSPSSANCSPITKAPSPATRPSCT